ncbi:MULTISPECIES: hypothetical protein [Cupriavidus]
MNNNRGMLFSLLFIAVIWISIAYSCQSAPSLGEIRSAREMMREDMKVIRQMDAIIIDFDDDKKAKIGSAMFAAAIASESWSPDQASKYEAALTSLGWVKSNISGGNIFFCKQGASALIMDFRKNNEKGYFYMKYPLDPRAKCGK